MVNNDITKEFGTIINSTNSELNNCGGIAAAISNAGGNIINE